jgi:hypothetical protein
VPCFIKQIKTEKEICENGRHFRRPLLQGPDIHKHQFQFMNRGACIYFSLCQYSKLFNRNCALKARAPQRPLLQQPSEHFMHQAAASSLSSGCEFIVSNRCCNNQANISFIKRLRVHCLQAQVPVSSLDGTNIHMASLTIFTDSCRALGESAA